MARISDFKAKLIGGGTRPNQFRVKINFPVDISNRNIASTDCEYLIKSASLPSSNIQDIAVPFRGRTTHLAGERVFQPWTISVYNATNFAIRNAFEEWSALIQHHSNTEGVTNPFQYVEDVRLEQLDRDDTVLKTYVLHNAYPSDLGALPNDYDAQNQLQIFDVQFQYDYWTSESIQRQDARGGADDPFRISLNLDTPFGSIGL